MMRAAAIAIVVAICGYLVVRNSASSAPLQQQAPTAQQLFLAAEQPRDEWMERVNTARVNAARYGIEPGKAGFHLIRPDDDPEWTDASSTNCSGNVYCWDYPQLKYQDVTYNSYGTVPSPISGMDMPPFCLLSLGRVFSNTLGTVTVVDEGGGSFGVSGSFSSRSIGALQALLAPSSDEPTYGLLDWFGTPRSVGEAETLMRVVLVSDNFAYLPVVVQDIVAQGPGPVAVTIATGLSYVDAQALVAKYAL